MYQNGAGGWRLVRLLSGGGGFLRAASRSVFNEQRVEEVAKVNFVLKIRLAYRTALCANDPGAIDDHDLRDLQTVCGLAAQVSIHLVRRRVAHQISDSKPL